MKQIIRWLGLFFIVIYVQNPVAAVGPKDEDKYEHWLKEEVQLLITAEEKDAFLKLTDDEQKDQFIELFWARRDPTPGTRENEFREEWERRLDYVTRAYARGSVSKGWHTDMGRVHMIFGPPVRTQASAGGVKSESSGGSQMVAPTEYWLYRPMPDLGLHDAFRVTFRNYQYGYDLDVNTSQQILRALEIFRQKVIFNPDLKELPVYRFRLDENSFEGNLIKDFAATGQEVKQIALEWQPIFMRAPYGETYVTLLVRVDPQNIDTMKSAEVTFFGRLKGEGEEFQDFLKTVKLEKGPGDTGLAVFGFPASPGWSVLYLGATDTDKKNYSLLKSDLNVENFDTNELDTSTLILCTEVISRPKSETSEESSPFVTEQFEATPRWGNVFEAGDTLNVLFQIYNAKLKKNAVSLVAEYFIVAPKLAFRLNPQVIRQKINQPNVLTGGTQVPLSPLEPGSYTFVIRLTDKIANITIEKSTGFIVK